MIDHSKPPCPECGSYDAETEPLIKFKCIKCGNVIELPEDDAEVADEMSCRKCGNWGTFVEEGEA